MEGAPISVNRVTQIFRDLLYNYRDQMLATVIIGGYDEKEGGQVSLKNIFLVYGD